MKTFETEKHNIPKGATHYWNESCSGFFAWWNDNTKEMLCPDGLGTWCRASDLSDDIMHEIPNPHTETEFVKCEYGDKVSNIVMGFENNVQLYKLVNDEHWTIDELDDLFQIILNDCYIYRKVETEIDERREFVDECMRIGGLRARDGAVEVYCNLYDSGKFKLVETEK